MHNGTCVFKVRMDKIHSATLIWEQGKLRFADYTDSTDTNLHIVDADLSVVLLCLQLQLDVKEGDLGVLVTFRLHLKACIGKRLFKGHAGHQLRVLWKQTVGLLTQYILVGYTHSQTRTVLRWTKTVWRHLYSSLLTDLSQRMSRVHVWHTGYLMIV